MADEKGTRSRPPVADASNVLRIDSHRLLIAKRKAIIDALVADPERGKLLFANAALAFKDSGVDLSPAISNHVLHTVRQSPEATTRREKLTEQLRAALGSVPKPSDPEWLAKTLFTKLQVTPLATKGHEPTYRPAIPVEVQQRLRRHLAPSSRPRVPVTSTATQPTPPPWRLDLDAEVPSLKPASKAPKTVTVETLWFYLGAHELVRPLLELAIIERSVLPTLTREQYEKVKSGKPTGGFIDWVDTVSFPDRTKPAAKKAPVKKAPVKKAAAEKAPTKKTAPKKKPS